MEPKSLWETDQTGLRPNIPTYYSSQSTSLADVELSNLYAPPNPVVDCLPQVTPVVWWLARRRRPSTPKTLGSGGETQHTGITAEKRFAS